VNKYKVMAPDSNVIAGGWEKVAVIEAETDEQALAQAKKKWGDKAFIKKVKV
jgi:hypothetical protein